MKQLLLLFCLCLSLGGWAQMKNSLQEVRDYKVVDGKIVVELMVNGVFADFVLDLAGHTAILPEYIDKFKIDTTDHGNFGYSGHQYKQVEFGDPFNIETLLFGNSVCANGAPAFLLKDGDYLRRLGVAGVVGGSLFRNVVLTIDSRRKKLTVSNPYRPDYMKLDHRVTVSLARGVVFKCPVQLDGVQFSMAFDSWSDATLLMDSADFARLKGEEVTGMKTGIGYGPTDREAKARKVSLCHFVKEDLKDVVAVESPSLSCSALGRGLLEYGLVSLDYTKNKVYFQPFDLVPVKDVVGNTEKVTIEPGKLNPINRDYFLANIYDYRSGKDEVYKGNRPVVIDFWASWCGPCMRLLPQMEQLAEKYRDKVVFMKVNADREKELCERYGIRALPTLFFITADGRRTVEVGVNPEKFVQIIEEKLLK